MDLARVIGTVVCTRKVPEYHGRQLVIVQPVDHQGQAVGEPEVALDPAYRSAPGERVLYVTSGDAAVFEAGPAQPVDATILGSVDGHACASEGLQDGPVFVLQRTP